MCEMQAKKVLAIKTKKNTATPTKRAFVTPKGGEVGGGEKGGGFSVVHERKNKNKKT